MSSYSSDTTYRLLGLASLGVAAALVRTGIVLWRKPKRQVEEPLLSDEDSAIAVPDDEHSLTAHREEEDVEPPASPLGSILSVGEHVIEDLPPDAARGMVYAAVATSLEAQHNHHAQHESPVEEARGQGDLAADLPPISSPRPLGLPQEHPLDIPHHGMLVTSKTSSSEEQLVRPSPPLSEPSPEIKAPRLRLPSLKTLDTGIQSEAHGPPRLALPGAVMLFEEKAASFQSGGSGARSGKSASQPDDTEHPSEDASGLPQAESPHTYALNLPDDANPFLPGSGDEMMGFSPGEEASSEAELSGDGEERERLPSVLPPLVGDAHVPGPPSFPQLRLPAEMGVRPVGSGGFPLSGPEEEASSALDSEVDQFELEVDGEPGDEGWPDWQAGPLPRTVHRRSTGSTAGSSGRAAASSGGIPLFSAFPAYGATPAATLERTRSGASTRMSKQPSSRDLTSVSPGQYQSYDASQPVRRRTASMDLRSPTDQILSSSERSGASPPDVSRHINSSPLSARSAAAAAAPATPRFSTGSYNPFQIDRAGSTEASRTSAGTLLQQLHQHQQQPAPQLQGLAPPPHVNLAPPASTGGGLPHSPFTALHRPGLDRVASNFSTVTLSRVLEDEDAAYRSSMELEAALALKLDVLGGPCLNTSFLSEEGQVEVFIGRAATMHLCLAADAEVSGRHLAVNWSTLDRCWKAADLGSLNGTLLNGEPISVGSRRKGAEYRLSSDDVLQLGSYTKIKVSIFPRDVLRPSDAQGSLPPDSLPRSLSMPKHRVMSFGSLASPSLRSTTPSRQPYSVAVTEDLRLEVCLISRTGREHARKNQACEDVACAYCPLPLHPRLVPMAASLLCVFDGHCGRGAADAASRVLPEEVAGRLIESAPGLSSGTGAKLTFKNAFLTTDARLQAEEGCTATTVLAWAAKDGTVRLQAANVGDSSALWIDVASGRVQELTEDHRLSNERERRRLSEMGIELSKESRRLYGLNLSRGLGDVFLKDEDLGLSAEPYVGPVVSCTTAQGGLLLIASDGLWDVADFPTVGRLVSQAFRENGNDLATTTRTVLSHAIKRRTKDDVSIVLAHVWPEVDWALRSPPQNSTPGPVYACP